MILQLVGIAALVGVAGFLTWERNDMAVTRIHAALRERRATDVRIARDWFGGDRYAQTYDVEYTDPDGQRQASTCRIDGGLGGDDGLYWSEPLVGAPRRADGATRNQSRPRRLL